jgi:hypothetical protein
MMETVKANKYACEKLARAAAKINEKRIGYETIARVEESSAIRITRNDPFEGVVVVRYEW